MTSARAWFAGLSLHAEQPAPKPAEVRCLGGCYEGRLRMDVHRSTVARWPEIPPGVTIDEGPDERAHPDPEWASVRYPCAVCRPTGPGGDA